ncbi:MAG: hypothetical protein OXJ55_11525 [Caldilineaceae bacterium]|nr:hypothetical protein [Caldilineaceae bacterium]MDE0501375.1 hypothetical protein [bacterium]
MEHGALRGGDPQDIGAWALRVYQTVKELLDPEHDIVAAAETMRHDLRALDFLPPGFRRQREIDFRLSGPIRAQGYGAVMAAAIAERGDPAVLRVVDLHPWVAEPAEPLFDDGHWFSAVSAAADNLRSQWKLALKVKSTKDLDLPSVFSPSDPKPGKPRMRFTGYDRERDEDEWKNAHEGAMHFARGCMKRIRNLYKYQTTEQTISSGLALETLATLSRLARWITDAKVVRCDNAAGR